MQDFLFTGGVSGAETSGQPASVSCAVVLWFICRQSSRTFAPHAKPRYTARVPSSGMSLVDLIIPVLIALAVGFALGFLYVQAQISAIEARYRAELETWKLEATSGIRKDSVNRSRSTLKGRIAEQMAPLLPEFAFNPADARFIGSPVDYIIFDGLTDVADDKKKEIRIIFMDVKQGTGNLSRTQRVIRDAVLAKQVGWETLRVAGE